MDGRRPARAGAQNPAYRPARPPPKRGRFPVSARTRAGHLTWASILGVRVDSPWLSAHGPVVRPGWLHHPELPLVDRVRCSSIHGRRWLELWNEPQRGGVHPFRGEGAITASPKWPLGAHRDRGGPRRADQRLGGRAWRIIQCLPALSRADRRSGSHPSPGRTRSGEPVANRSPSRSSRQARCEGCGGTRYARRAGPLAALPLTCPVRGKMSTSSRCGGPVPGSTGWLPTSSR